VRDLLVDGKRQIWKIENSPVAAFPRQYGPGSENVVLFDSDKLVRPSLSVVGVDSLTTTAQQGIQILRKYNGQPNAFVASIWFGRIGVEPAVWIEPNVKMTEVRNCNVEKVSF